MVPQPTQRRSFLFAAGLLAGIAVVAHAHPTHADAWDRYLRLATLKADGLPDGVSNHPSVTVRNPIGNGLPIEQRLPASRLDNFAPAVEADSVELYRLAAPGTPFIGVVNIATGTIYLHPSPLAFETVVGTPEQLGEGAMDFMSAMVITAPWRAQLPATWQARFPVGQYLALKTNKYTENQLPAGMFSAVGQIDISGDDEYAAVIARSARGLLADVRHDGAQPRAGDTRSDRFVYHARNQNFLLPEEAALTSALCPAGIVEGAASHDCLVQMLGRRTPHLGFAITKRDRGYCDRAPADRIGKSNALYFTGTSASQNDRVFNLEIRNGHAVTGPMRANVARILYNALVRDLVAPEADEAARAGIINGLDMVPCAAPAVVADPVAGRPQYFVGEPMELNVDAFAAGQHKSSFECQWQRADVEEDAVGVFADIATPAGRRCTFKKVAEAADAGAYRVRVANQLGAVVSGHVVVPVVVPAVPELAPIDDVTVASGAALVIDAALVEPVGPVTCRWEKRNGEVWTRLGGDDARLDLGLAGARDAGTYRVTARNTSGASVAVTFTVAIE